MDFSNKIKNSMYWWLGKKNPFIINNEYKLELLFLDKINNSAKILITNLKTGETTSQDVISNEADNGQR
jgi:hypothetical protein